MSLTREQILAHADTRLKVVLVPLLDGDVLRNTSIVPVAGVVLRFSGPLLLRRGGQAHPCPAPE